VPLRLIEPSHQVWFDETQNQGIYHQDWRLEDDPTALATFRSALKKHR
jgi:hypothetical protein